MIISITGTPGVGKTTVAKRLAKRIGYRYVDLVRFIKKNNIYEGYDKKRKAIIVDEKKLKKLKFEDAVIDGHLSHFIPSDLIIVLRLDPKELERRLKRRKYSSEKIKENVEAEILDVIYYEALKNGKNVFQINATNRKTEEVVEIILKILKGKKVKSDAVNWLNKCKDLLSNFY